MLRRQRRISRSHSTLQLRPTKKLLTSFLLGMRSMLALIAYSDIFRRWDILGQQIVGQLADSLTTALNQAIPVLFDIRGEHEAAAYLLRLAAYVTIIIAILAKNILPKDRR